MPNGLEKSAAPYHVIIRRFSAGGALGGERPTNKSLRTSLFKYTLHAAEELLEKAYRYIRKYY